MRSESSSFYSLVLALGHSAVRQVSGAIVEQHITRDFLIPKVDTTTFLPPLCVVLDFGVINSLIPIDWDFELGKYYICKGIGEKSSFKN